MDSSINNFSVAVIKQPKNCEDLFDRLDLILAGEAVDLELLISHKNIFILTLQNQSQLEMLANWLREYSPDKMIYVMGQADEAAAIVKLFAGLRGEFVEINSPNSRKFSELKFDDCFMVLNNRFAIDQAFPLIKDFSIGSFCFYNNYGELRHIADTDLYSASLQLLKSWSEWEWESQRHEKNRD